MAYNENMANAHMAFTNGQFAEALRYVEKARSEASNDNERVSVLVLEGKTMMSIDKASEASDSFLKASRIMPQDGNIHFLLGYARATSGDFTGALSSFTRALGNDCESNLRGQIYKLIAMIDMERGDYKNGLKSLEQAEKFLGLDYEILQRKAECYDQEEDYVNALFTTNQLKLLSPDIYLSYSQAFHMFMKLGMYDEAKRELARAEEYAEIDMFYYFDMITYILFNNPENDTMDTAKDKWKAALEILQEGLENGRPTSEQVVEIYLQAVKILISLKEPQRALACLQAIENPIESYNEGFKVYEKQSIEGICEPNCNKKKVMSMEELSKWAKERNLSEVKEGALSPVAVAPVKEPQKLHKLEGEYVFRQEERDVINSLYLNIYEMICDYDGMHKKARELQSSDIVVSTYCGMFYELRVSKLRNEDKWQVKYRDRINFWTKQIILDPNDSVAAMYRVRAYIDLGEFENARLLCECLPSDEKERLKKEIEEGEHGN